MVFMGVTLSSDTRDRCYGLWVQLRTLIISSIFSVEALILGCCAESNQITILNNPDAPFCLKRKFNFLSSIRSAGLRTRACAFNLQVPYPRSNSGKGTFAYSAATLFNCLDTDIKQIACVSPSSIIFSSRLNNFKHKLFILFLKFASSVSHLEALMCHGCRFSLYCNCIRR